MRYPSSILIAVIFSFFAFLGMSYLVSSPKMIKSTPIDMISFSMIDDMEPPKIIDKSKPKLPKKEVIKAVPAMPHIDIASKSDRPTFKISTVKTDLSEIGLVNQFIPDLPQMGPRGTSNDGGLMELVGIQPVYPNEAKRGGIEGWVKVEFVVNKFGLVSKAKVIDSQPKRVFNQATLRAIYKSKFKPLIIDGQAIAQTAVRVFEFKLEQ